MKILFTGGGTLGSVTPLIALHGALRDQHPTDSLSAQWVGTSQGPERGMIENIGLPFFAIHSGKLRRYFDWNNFLDPFLLTAGLFQAIVIIIKFRPNVIVSAGGYVAVPVLWAGWLLGVKCVIFQLDVQAGLANRIATFCATKIGVALPEEAVNFPKNKTEVVGIPIRAEVREVKKDAPNCNESLKCFGFDSDTPLVLIVGGGTGAQTLNELIVKAVSLMRGNIQILHLTGKGKNTIKISPDSKARYQAVEFLGPELPALLACANLVITRAGMGTLSELAYLGKAAIVIPIPDSHQEQNAAYFEQKKAVRYISQKKLTPQRLAQEIEKLIDDASAMGALEAAINTVLPLDSTERACSLIQQVVRE